MPDNTVTDVGFAEFVATLLVETLDSIVASHTSQEERLRALESAAGLTTAEVAATTVTAGMVDAAVADLFPDGDGGTTIRTGGPAPDQDALKELAIELKDRPDGLVAADVTKIRNAVALFLAARYLESVQEVARRGVPRVLVEGGTLRAKLAFTTTRIPSSGAPPASTTSSASVPASGMALARPSTGLSPAVARTTLADLGSTRLRQIESARLLTFRPEVLDGIRDLRLLVRPPTTTTSPGQPDERADVFGEIEIRFRTEG
ncbi:MAG: hypothetical protein ABI249_03365 [Ornithinibacter sp.]